jgi:hypothetical protein
VPHPLYTSWGLILLGVLMLIVFIPFTGNKFKDSRARTEFFSVKAAYSLIVCGVALMLLAELSMLSQQIIIAIKK